MEKFIQEFRKAVRDSEYEKKLLVDKFKQGMNRVIRRKLVEAEQPPKSIKQLYKKETSLDRHWRKNKRKEERLREKKETEALT